MVLILKARKVCTRLTQFTKFKQVLQKQNEAQIVILVDRRYTMLFMCSDVAHLDATCTYKLINRQSMLVCGTYILNYILQRCSACSATALRTLT